MITGWPRDADSFSGTVGATVWVVPPAANGTIHLIGFVGQDCAVAMPAQPASSTARKARLMMSIPAPRVTLPACTAGSRSFQKLACIRFRNFDTRRRGHE